MNRHVNAIAGRLSLRPPQRRSLEILGRVTEIVPPRKGSPMSLVKWESRPPGFRRS
jgi:type III restriction enzyme